MIAILLMALLTSYHTLDIGWTRTQDARVGTQAPWPLGHQYIWVWWIKVMLLITKEGLPGSRLTSWLSTNKVVSALNEVVGRSVGLHKAVCMIRSWVHANPLVPKPRLNKTKERRRRKNSRRSNFKKRRRHRIRNVFLPNWFARNFAHFYSLMTSKRLHWQIALCVILRVATRTRKNYFFFVSKSGTENGFIYFEVTLDENEAQISREDEHTSEKVLHMWYVQIRTKWIGTYFLLIVSCIFRPPSVCTARVHHVMSLLWTF